MISTLASCAADAYCGRCCQCCVSQPSKCASWHSTSCKAAQADVVMAHGVYLSLVCKQAQAIFGNPKVVFMVSAEHEISWCDKARRLSCSTASLSTDKLVKHEQIQVCMKHCLSQIAGLLFASLDWNPHVQRGAVSDCKHGHITCCYLVDYSV